MMGRKARTITINGITKTISQWEAATGVSYHTITKRLRQGYTGEMLIAPVYQCYAGKLTDAETDTDADEKAVNELWHGRWIYQGG